MIGNGLIQHDMIVNIGVCIFYDLKRSRVLNKKGGVNITPPFRKFEVIRL
jgi:hypothetical protein